LIILLRAFFALHRLDAWEQRLVACIRKKFISTVLYQKNDCPDPASDPFSRFSYFTFIFRKIFLP